MVKEKTPRGEEKKKIEKRIAYLKDEKDKVLKDRNRLNKMGEEISKLDLEIKAQKKTISDEKKLGQIKIDPDFVNETMNKLIADGYKPEDAKKMAELEGMISTSKSRIEILEGNPKIKDQVKRLESAKKVLETSSAELNKFEKKTPEQKQKPIIKIAGTPTSKKDVTNLSQEIKRGLETSQTTKKEDKDAGEEIKGQIKRLEILIENELKILNDTPFYKSKRKQKDYLKSLYSRLTDLNEKFESEQEGYKAGDVVEFSGKNLDKIKKEAEEQEKNIEYIKSQIEKRVEEIKKRQAELAPLLGESKNKDAREEYDELVKELLSTNKKLDQINNEFLISKDADKEVKQNVSPEISKESRAGTAGWVTELIKKGEEEEKKYKPSETAKSMMDLVTKSVMGGKEEKISDKKEELEKTIEKNIDDKTSKIVQDKIKISGLKEEDFKSIPGWETLSSGEKLLVVEQSSQEVLSRVKEIGEQRFQEKNKMDLTWKVWKWKRGSITKKIWHKLGKAYWISKEEKEVIKEAENRKLKPDAKILSGLVARTQDMHLKVEEKDGRAIIKFIEENKELPSNYLKSIKKYNEYANNFSKMPDSWRNEKAARNLDKEFWNKNHKKYNSEKSLFEEAKKELITSKAKYYEEEKGMKKEDAEALSMLEMNSLDYKIYSMQSSNTNPDALGEIANIKKELSTGRLINNENMWRAIYIGSGYTARSITTATFGLLAAPAVSSIIGAFRGNRKAKLEINKAFFKGFENETFLERQQAGKKGSLEDRGFFSKILSEGEVNAKQVGAFIDADSQILRINNLTKKIDSVKNDAEKSKLISQLFARLSYIENKHKEGLINYGTQNKLATNYNLLKLVSECTVKYTMENPSSVLAKEEADEIEKNKKEVERRLDYVLSNNKKYFDKEQRNLRLREISRGIVMAGAFSYFGIKLREWMPPVNFNLESIKKFIPPTPFSSNYYMPNIISHVPGIKHTLNDFWHSDHNLSGVVNNENLQPENVDAVSGADKISGVIKNVTENEINGPFMPHYGVEVVVEKGQGAISTIRELQRVLKLEYASDLDTAPVSVKHIIETEADKLAQEYDMYNPGNEAESALIKPGSKFTVDSNGNVRFDNTILERGTVAEGNYAYNGEMFDSDLSGIKTLNGIIDKIPDQNIAHIFPGDKMSVWESVKDSPVSTILNLNEVKPEHQELVEYLKKLQQISGVKPLDTYWEGRESISDFINRNLHIIRGMGIIKLKEVALDENTFKDYTDQELLDFDKKIDSYDVIPEKVTTYDHVIPRINQIPNNDLEIEDPTRLVSLFSEMERLNVEKIDFEKIGEIRKFFHDYNQTIGGTSKRDIFEFIKNENIKTIVTSTEISPIPRNPGEEMRFNDIAQKIASEKLNHIYNLSEMGNDKYLVSRQVFSKELPDGKIKVFIVDLLKEKTPTITQADIDSGVFQENIPSGVTNDDGFTPPENSTFVNNLNNTTPTTQEGENLVQTTTTPEGGSAGNEFEAPNRVNPEGNTQENLDNNFRAPQQVDAVTREPINGLNPEDNTSPSDIINNQQTPEQRADEFVNNEMFENSLSPDGRNAYNSTLYKMSGEKNGLEYQMWFNKFNRLLTQDAHNFERILDGRPNGEKLKNLIIKMREATKLEPSTTSQGKPENINQYFVKMIKYMEVRGRLEEINKIVEEVNK